jgi:hypothetical protein
MNLARTWFVLVLAACDAGAPVPQPVSPSAQPTWPPPAPAPSPPVTSALTVDGRTYAVVRLQEECGEATNLGGEHWTFDVDGMPAGFQLHGGGHGIFGDGTTLPGRVESSEVWVGRYYVAEVRLLRAPSEIGGLTCTYHEKFDGTVSAVSPAKDLDDARRQLAAIPGAGFDPVLRIDRENYRDRMKGQSLERALHGL